MDATNFVKKLDPLVAGRVKDHVIRVTRDNFPTSVDFLVISPDFANLSRAERIDFLADVVKEAFGYVPTRISGVALTPQEASDLDSNAAEEGPGHEYLGSDGSAAMPAGHD